MRSPEEWERFWLGQTPDSPKEMAPEDFARAVQCDTLEAAASFVRPDNWQRKEDAESIRAAILALKPGGPDRAPPVEMTSDELLDAFLAIAGRRWSAADRMFALEAMFAEGRISKVQYLRQIQKPD